MRLKYVGFLGAGLAVVAGGIWFARNHKEELKWRQVPLQRGGLQQRISATGSVAPLVQVAVGTQVSGVISALYADYNSVVHKGQLIAQIDPTILETNLKDAQASAQRSKDTLDNALRQYDRGRRLHEQKLVSDQDLDALEIAYRAAKAGNDNALAAVERAQANLGYCNITAPVDGVVISRLADVGQTVAASFSTPNLFNIAQDLSKMKVETQIDEADIDSVQVGQRALFTIDSLPDKQFVGKVNEVRLEPLTNNNVVTYKVVIEVPNEPLAGPEAGGPRAQASGVEPARDPEKAWERMKDRLPPEVTKEAFLRRFKERMAQASSPAPKPVPRGPAEREAAAHTPGGTSLLGGPRFEGNVALKPGMTANVTIVTQQRADVLKVPNAALRFNPSNFMKDEKKEVSSPRPGGLGMGMGMGMGMGPRPGGGQGGNRGGMIAKREDRVWVLEAGKPRAIPVKAGISDGQFTEVVAEGLQEGMAILVGAEDPAKKAAAGPPSPAGPGARR